jgi:hypothetical protein
MDFNEPSVVPSVTSPMKWWLAIILGFIFFIFAYGGTYNLTNKIWTTLGGKSYLTNSGSPNIWGVIIHAILFTLFIRLLLW